ncbi:MAG: hypothetical protein JNM84_25685 [Planctomycetes bacterium]|nr:hypothetical protein [Planctomycetota bacterium]
MLRLRASSALLCFAFAAPSPGQEAPVLWRNAPAPSPAVLTWIAEEQRANPAFGAAHVVALDLAALQPLLDRPSEAQRVQVELGGAPCELVLERAERTPLHLVVRGRRANSDDRCALAIGENGACAGWFERGDRRYALVQHGASGAHVVREVIERALAPCGNHAAHEIATAPDPASPRIEGVAAVTIDVIAFFTPAARRGAGSAEALAAAVEADVQRANEANERASVDLRFRLVHARETSYVEDGTGNDLSRFQTNGDGIMDEVHGLRSLYGADLCTLITNQSSQFCGIAYVMTSPGAGFRPWAFSVNVRGCLGGTVVAHEIGHNLGCAHDRQNAGSGAYSYSFGYRTPDSAWRSVMAYSPGASVTTWSNPQVVHQGQAMGTATEDNARSIRRTMSVTAAFTPEQAIDFCVLDGGVSTGFGLVPILRGGGFVNGLEAPYLRWAGAPQGTPGALVIGLVEARTPFFAGILVPALQLSIPITGSFYATTVDASGLRTLPIGTELWLQALFFDPTAAQSMALSHGLRVRLP